MKFNEIYEKLDYLKVTILAFILNSIYSSPLWFSTTSIIPKSPVFGEASYMESFGLYDLITCVATFCILFIGSWFKKSKWLVLGLIFLLIICLIDLNRFNAITYFFACIWILWLCNQDSKIQFQSSILIFIAALYFWAGIQKWNIHFYLESYQWFMNLTPLTRKLVEMKTISYIIPALELIPSLLILVPKFRKIGVIWLISMHCYIIFMMTIVEWGKGIIVWNLFMIFLVASFWVFKEKTSNIFKIQTKFTKLILLFVSFIFPLLFCFDIVSSELGYAMYCGRFTTGKIAMTDTDKSKFDIKYHPYLDTFQNFNLIDLDYFAFKSYSNELNRTEFNYKKMFRKLSEPFSDSCMLVIVRKPMFGQETYEYVYKSD